MNILSKYLVACDDLAEAFYHKYYNKEEARGEYFEWLHGIGSFFTISDQCFTTQEMLRAMQLNVTKEQLLGWHYDNWDACCERSKLSLDAYMKGNRVQTRGHRPLLTQQLARRF